MMVTQYDWSPKSQFIIILGLKLEEKVKVIIIFNIDLQFVVFNICFLDLLFPIPWSLNSLHHR